MREFIEWLYYQDLLQVTLWMFLTTVLMGVLGALGRRWCPRLFRCVCAGLCLYSTYVIMGYTYLWRDTEYTEVVFLPFNLLIEAQKNPNMYRSMLMNVFFFMPLGTSMSLSLPDKLKHKLIWCVAFGCILSLFVETMQYVYAVGRSEVDDVMTNTLGTWLGTASLVLAMRLKPAWLRLRGMMTEKNNTQNRSDSW